MAYKRRSPRAAEQQCANNAWRIQVLEGWYWWCNANENGQPYAAQSSVANPANSKGKAPRKNESKKAREASPPSDVTKSPGEFSEVSEAPTLVPADAVHGDGALSACEPIPEHGTGKKSAGEKKSLRRRLRTDAAEIAKGQRGGPSIMEVLAVDLRRNERGSPAQMQAAW